MPDPILDIVSAGVEIAKEVEKKPYRDPVVAEELPENEADYNNVKNDVGSALKKGERFLTEAEAKARRQEIMKQRQAEGLNPLA